MRRRTLITITVGLVAVAAAGAVAATPLAPQSIANRAAARHEAAAALASLSLPSGSTVSATDPSTRSVLRRYGPVGPGSGSGNLVGDHRYWRVPGAPQTVINWIKSHPPAGAHSYSQGVAGLPFATPEVLYETFTFKSSTSGVEDRALAIEVTSARGGGAAVRADGQAVWFLAKPAWEQIPAGATAVTVTVTWGSHGRSRPITLTAPAKVAGLTRIVDHAPPVQPGGYSCPAGGDYNVELAFRTTPHGAVLALVRAELEDGCDWLGVDIGGRKGLQLWQGYQLAAAAYKLGGLASCAASQIRARASLPQHSSGSSDYDADLHFRNVSSAACTVDGYPALSMRAAGGRPITTQATHAHFAPEFEALIPGASATAFVDWRSACPAQRAATLTARLPRIPTAFVIQLGSRRHPWDPCHGHLTVSPLGPF